ncbi:nucleotidyltransferase [Lutibacter sp. B2]|nr:nucleotidyltransferase [Lutibacter sp. B2]
MKVLGIIAEYNPFHNGHKYHLLDSLHRTNTTHSVAIMSGNFLQRGAPALLNKWERAKMAVKEGVDLVIELPFPYACNSAEYFAFGAISLLNSLNIIDYVSFGSECGNIEKLKTIASVLTEEPIEYKTLLKSFLSKGNSFPSARENALSTYLNDSTLEEIIRTPNNILGIEYIKALINLNSKMEPFTINRIKTEYHSKNIENSICSATAIRNHLTKDSYDISLLSSVMPNDSYAILSENIKEELSPIHISDFSQMILYSLRKSSTNVLKEIVDVTEGLENRIKNASSKAVDIELFLQLTKTKRYPLTRLQRICIHTLLGLTKDHILKFSSLGTAPYARILAFSSKGKELIKTLKKTSSIPILTNINKQPLSNEIANEMLSLDILSSDLYNLAYVNKKNRTGGDDYYEKPYIHI